MGKPYGTSPVDPVSSSHSYKIVVDPYYKRFTVEKYTYTTFEKIVYDSALLDFRRLHSTQEAHQAAWLKEELKHEGQTIHCLLRDQDDRAILYETHSFDGHLCRSCSMHSIHGLLLSTHRMYYTSLHDPFNGVVLFDLENRPVMMKTYEFDSETLQFTRLLSEEWNMEILPALLINIDQTMPCAI